MSSASIPAPRTPAPGSSSRHAPTLFWPMFILLIGAGSLALFQVGALEDRLEEVTRAVDKIDSKVKASQHDQALFYSLSRDVLSLAPKNPNAEQIVVDFKLRQLRALQPT